jgi:hypothetical protein
MGEIVPTGATLARVSRPTAQPVGIGGGSSDRAAGYAAA